MVPLAIADVNGEKAGWNARMNGSRDESLTRNDISASISSFSSMRPVPDIASRVDATSTS